MPLPISCSSCGNTFTPNIGCPNFLTEFCPLVFTGFAALTVGWKCSSYGSNLSGGRVNDNFAEASAITLSLHRADRMPGSADERCFWFGKKDVFVMWVLRVEEDEKHRRVSDEKTKKFE